MAHDHTYAHRHTETDTDTIFTFYTFLLIGIHAIDTNFIFGIPQTYTCRDSDLHTRRHTHVQRHWSTDVDMQRHMHVCIDIQTQHTLMCM